MEEKEDVDVATIIMSSSSFVTQICNVMRLQYIVLDKLFFCKFTTITMEKLHSYILKDLICISLYTSTKWLLKYVTMIITILTCVFFYNTPITWRQRATDGDAKAQGSDDDDTK